MQNKTKLFIGTVIVVIFIYLFLPTRGSAKLEGQIRQVIIIAYMNGYADALKLKNEEIRRLKSNGKLLEKRVKEAAAVYINTVENLNKN